MSQFITPGVLASLRSLQSLKGRVPTPPKSRPGADGHKTRRDEPSSASRIRIDRERDDR